MHAHRFRKHIVAAILVLGVAGVHPGRLGSAWGAALEEAGDAPQSLYEAYFLEKESRDYDAARALYQKVLERRPSSRETRLAQAGVDRCRDQLVAQDFASVMPPEALVYVEIRRPGEIARQLAGMLGLNDKPIASALAGRPNAQSSVPFHVPNEIVISPSIFDALGAFGGAAVALTEIDIEGDHPPSGVIVLHHGDCTMLKGLLETSFQFAPTAEKIRELPTFGAQIPEVGTVTGVLTESLLIVGTNRGLVEGVVSRIQGDRETSLAASKDLKDAMADRKGGTLFAYVDLQKMMANVKRHLRPRDAMEFAQVNVIADLEGLRWATLRFGIDDDVLAAQLAVRLADDHHSLVYNLLRLSPMSRNCLSKVPGDAAAIIGIGLNPEIKIVSDAGRTEDAHAGAAPAISGFDMGREFFGNIQEICAFVVPGSMGTFKDGRHETPIPNIGVVVSVNDVAKSKALWNELLKLPGLFGGKEPIAPEQTSIGGVSATAYAIPEFGRVYLGELDGCVVFGLTRDALKAAVQTHKSGRSILKDDSLGQVVADMPKDTSILLAGHVGRLAQVATGANDMQVSMVANPVSQICHDTVAWFTISQSPNQFTVRFATTGLPKINEVLRQFGPVINAATGTMMQKNHHQAEAAADHGGAPARKPAL